MQTVLATHPWLSFRVEAKEIIWQTWLLFGEARSKCLHLSGVPLAPEIQKRMTQAYLVKGVQATTAIEGNTLSQEDVENCAQA